MADRARKKRVKMMALVRMCERYSQARRDRGIFVIQLEPPPPVNLFKIRPFFHADPAVAWRLWKPLYKIPDGC